MAKNEMTTSTGVHNVLASGTSLIGNIYSEEDFRIDGTIEGNIVSKGKIIVGPQSSITGNIECVNVELHGRLAGDIACSGTVILRNSANLTGNIETQSLEIEPGALFWGTCSMVKG